MLSLSRLAPAAGLILFAVGVGLTGFGYYERATNTCESGYGISIDRLGTDEAGESNAEEISYQNLTAAEREVFRGILTPDAERLYQNSAAFDGLAGKVVTYRGQRYETSEVFVSDCFNTWSFYRNWGILLAVLGGSVAAVVCGLRRSSD